MNLTQMTIISTTVGKNPLEEMEQPSQTTRVQNAVLGCNLKNDRIISVRFQGKPFNIAIIQVYAPTSNAEEAEVEQFYEDLPDLLELTPKKDVLFIIWNAKVGTFQKLEFPDVQAGFRKGRGTRDQIARSQIDWNAKVGSQEIVGVTGKFGFGVQNEAGQRVIEF